jgi:hypothetical protein
MDNKNQDNNPVGDDFNLSHDNQLPPIWDNISKELNALDEDAMPTNEDVVDPTDLSDVANFSIIKEGFQTNFDAKEPPKFMWDKIEQDLESLTTTDAPSDFSAIKTGFEQNYKKTPAPNFTWDDLAEEMDNPTPKEKVEDYGFVKRGFEKQYSAVVVPLFSWADLAQRMDNESIISDSPDNYSIVKESFQKEYAAHKPAANTWAALDQELQAQSHWRKALVFLLAPAFLKKAALFSVIGAFILGGNFYLSEHPVTFKTPSSALVANNEVDENASLFDEIKISSLADAISRSYEKNAAAQPNSIKEQDQDEQDQDEQDQDEMNMALFLPKKKASKLERNTTTGSKENPTSTDNFTTSKDGNNKNKSDDSKIVDAVELKKNNLESSFIDKYKTTIDQEKGRVSNQDEILISNLKLLANTSSINSIWMGQDMMDVELLDDGLSILVQKYILDEDIPQMEEESFPLVRQMQKGKKIRFEIGLVGRAGTSILLGQNTYSAWGDNDATTKLCPTGGFGLLSNYHFSLNDAVVLGVYPYSTMEQCFGRYDVDGNYEETKLNLSLFDVTLGYQRTLIRYNSLSEVPSKIHARLDVGLGILTSAKTSINEELINTDDMYNNLNFSVGLTLGNTHEIKQFVIDYGITGNIGVNNLVSKANPTILEPAKLLNVGGYLGLRYLIVPRLEPSKKQRQFDWSPPFYIEEPPF